MVHNNDEKPHDRGSTNFKSNNSTPTSTNSKPVPDKETMDPRKPASDSSHPLNRDSPVRQTSEKEALESQPPPPATTSYREEDYHAQGLRLFLILASLLVSIFCQALDDTIIATAIPRISDEFRRLNDVGWYGSAYLLTNAAFQLFYSKLYTLLPLRWVFLVALAIFEVGSLIAAVAPTSAALIAGRAIAGCGASGITSGALNIMAHVTPAHRRPLFVSLIGAVYGVASVAGPLIGGAFAERVTWRWCFYINLPIGAVVIVVLLLTLKRLPPSAQGKRSGSVLKDIQRLDPVGTISFLASIVCLLVALEFAGTRYPWSSGRVIALLTVFAVLLVVFVVAQVVQKDENATIPKHFLRNRSVSFGAVFAFCQGAAFNLFIFYIPLYFQGVKGTGPIESGLYYLPLILVNTVAILAAGVFTTKVGYYMPLLWASSILMSVGAGLLTLLRVDSNTGEWVGYQLVFALGSGFGLQQPFVVAQTALPLSEIAAGTGVMMFAQLGGGAVFVSAALSVFSSSLVQNVSALGLQGIDLQTLVNSGATELRSIVPMESLSVVLEAYNGALVDAYRVGLVMSCISVIGTAGMKWVSIKPKKEKDDEGDSSVARD